MSISGCRPWRRSGRVLNKGGVIMNLLRDDLGTNDPTPLRYENQFSQGVPPGEYTINLHLFRNLQGTFPVPVDVTVRCSADTKGARNVVNTKVQLNREGEVAALRFRLDEQCNLAPNSATSLHRSRSGPRRSRSFAGRLWPNVGLGRPAIGLDSKPSP